jgi:hypothetical protein
MSTMQYFDTLIVRVALASSLGTLTAFGLNGAVLGASTCFQEPNLNSSQGRHWYYRLDRINHRNCFYVTEAGPKTDEAPPLGPSPTSSPDLPCGSLGWGRVYRGRLRPACNQVQAVHNHVSRRLLPGEI